jgi:hypothetical protein
MDGWMGDPELELASWARPDREVYRPPSFGR